MIPSIHACVFMLWMMFSLILGRHAPPKIWQQQRSYGVVLLETTPRTYGGVSLAPGFPNLSLLVAGGGINEVGKAPWRRGGTTYEPPLAITNSVLPETKMLTSMWQTKPPPKVAGKMGV